MALKKDSSSKAEAKAKAKLAKAQAKVAKAEAKAAKAEAKAARAEAKAKGLAAEARAQRSPVAAQPAAPAPAAAPATAAAPAPVPAPAPAAKTAAPTPVRKPIPGPRPLPTLAEAKAKAAAAAVKPQRKAIPGPRPLPTLEHARASAAFKVLLNNTDRSRDISQPLSKLAPEEQLKFDSDYLKGGIEDDLIDEITLAVDENNNKLMKFHGIYMQDHRDHRDERRRQKLEPEYTFMLRARLPGGVCSPEQWLKIDELGRRYGGDTVRLTTRQTFQFHYLHRNTLRDVMVGLREVGLDSKAACGDVARTVMSGVHPGLSSLHKEVYEYANATSDHAIHRTSAYEEVWFGEKPERPRGENEEPFYGRQYMPRKFKIGFAIPPSNDVDIYSQDIGFIAVAEGGKLKGFNVAIGGGMGRTDRAPETYPRLGDVIGYIDAEHTLAAVDAIMGVQRDFGARDVRAHSRFKYTVDDKGVDWIKAAIEDRLGFQLGPVVDYTFTSNGDLLGWTTGDDGLEHYTLWLENGRIINHPDRPIMDGLRAIAESGKCVFRMTPNQSLILSDIAPADKPAIEALLAEYKLAKEQISSALRANSMACVAMPTCALAMAESERYLPELITKIEGQLGKYGLTEEPITIRMTGCPNGCARPYIAEIALTGRAPGKYNLYLGAGHHGQRLNKMLLENVGEEQILSTLDGTFAAFAKERQPGEHYGDFVVRTGVVAEVTEGRFFND
ncbi:MAG: NADPH-dependent assimilatory sulfite reductase hemoprotein subunit [Solirubrobacteraceae bacterium]|nr:NADPH-dependent assimilatory sulfite reductase hemoprotein subunit [Solirubrobacteraceae bacterium]